MTAEAEDPYLYDDDPFDTRKEDCGCGHRRSAHWPACNRQVERTDADAVPPAMFAPGDEDNPFAWPTNWPAPNALPKVTVPCECKEFYYPEPEPPDDH